LEIIHVGCKCNLKQFDGLTRLTATVFYDRSRPTPLVVTHVGPTLCSSYHKSDYESASLLILLRRYRRNALCWSSAECVPFSVVGLLIQTLTSSVTSVKGSQTSHSCSISKTQLVTSACTIGIKLSN